MKKGLVLALLCITTTLFAQKDSVLVKYANTITKEELKEHLTIIASDEYEGRETGMRGQKMAAEYISNYFSDLGVPPLADGTYEQSYPLRSESSLGSNLKIGGKAFEFIDDFYFFGGFEKVDLQFSEEEIVWAGYGIEDEKYSDYGDLDIKNKIVVLMSGEPFVKGKSLITGTDNYSDWTKEWRKKRDIAQKKGAKAVLIMNSNFDETKSRMRYWLENPSMRLVMEEEKEGEGAVVLPTFFVNKDVANALLAAGKQKSVESWIKKSKKKGKPASKSFTVDSGSLSMVNIVKDYTGSNVLAYIEGTDLKDELVVITGHYDHVGIINGEIHNGADDDGSGTVASLEIAEAFMEAKKNGNGPRRSVLVMTVSGEEKGLLGSRWYSENPVFPLEKTVCDLNIDMIGRVDEAHKDDSNYIYLIGSDKLSTKLHEVSEKANSTYTNLALDYTFNDPDDPNRYYYRSDHYNFAKKGIPVIFYFSGVHEDYHKPGDDTEKILFEKMEKVTRLIFSTAWTIANQDEGLPVDVENAFE